ncbi:MAG: hypothetical protein R2788_21615 [Saprospiraceae bacterium]
MEKIIHDAIANLPERCRVVFYPLPANLSTNHNSWTFHQNCREPNIDALVILRKALGPYVGEELLILILLFF